MLPFLNSPLLIPDTAVANNTVWMLFSGFLNIVYRAVKHLSSCKQDGTVLGSNRVLYQMHKLHSNMVMDECI